MLVLSGRGSNMFTAVKEQFYLLHLHLTLEVLRNTNSFGMKSIKSIYEKQMVN
jgi:hypothetical protein